MDLLHQRLHARRLEHAGHGRRRRAAGGRGAAAGAGRRPRRRSVGRRAAAPRVRQRRSVLLARLPIKFPKCQLKNVAPLRALGVTTHQSRTLSWLEGNRYSVWVSALWGRRRYQPLGSRPTSAETQVLKTLKQLLERYSIGCLPFLWEVGADTNHGGHDPPVRKRYFSSH